MNMTTDPIEALLRHIGSSPAGTTRMGGIFGSADAYVAVRLLKERFFVIFSAGSDEEAEDVYRNIETIVKLNPSFNGVNGSLFLSDDHESRVAALGRLNDQTAAANFIICSKNSLGMPAASAAFIQENSIILSPGETYARGTFIALLENGGYQRDNFVEMPGQYAVRGEIVDVWVPAEEYPFRIVYPSQLIESIKTFDVNTQRSRASQKKILVYPVKEMHTASVVYHAVNVASHGVLVCGEEKNIDLPADIPSVHRVIIDNIGNTEVTCKFESIPNFQKNIPLFCETLRVWQQDQYNTVIVSHNTGEMERLQELIYEHDADISHYADHHIGTLTRGFLSRDERIVYVSNGDVFGRYPRSFRMPRWIGGKILHSLGDITRGDYVVHEKYGIGIYQGLEEITVPENRSEYIKLEYKGNDYLYVPIDDFQKVQKYIGSEGRRPRLYSLDGIAWERLKQKVTKSVIELAGELIKTHASRMLKQGFSFSPVTHMEKEFADSFIYPETPDQARTITEVLADMQRPQPMDRIVCGDVGYGKTEVAMRAAFKAVNDSCQVAVLVPTTILAEQHYQTFTERLADYPVTIAFISRFQNKTEQKKILCGVRDGTVDIIIGTHRLLQKDVLFKNLKLIIVDEEHRFGVKHKERFKKQFSGVDILTLSATPIPRTLYMGLSGVRDLSLIETPPEGRQPIQTYVGPYDESLVKKAMEAEIGRGGQVFYVHNRVESITGCLKRLTAMLPSMRFGVVHGQMKSKHIEKAMWDFLHNRIDCLVATSIIESGLDIPRVNTLVVEDAHEMGLSQLYQLRGRVGREKKRAHCFLFFTPDRNLTRDAEKRLEALKEFTSLSSGFNLAMRDLEIRGAGNMLGARQHGFIRDVGFDLYTRLLKQEIERQRTGADTTDEKIPRAEEGPRLDLKLHAYLPSAYIPGDTERIRLYRKALSCADAKDLDFLRKELIDRFGVLPPEAENFFQILELRQTAVRLRIEAIHEVKQSCEVRFGEGHVLLPVQVLQLAKQYDGYIHFYETAEGFTIRLDEALTKGRDWLGWLKKFLSDIT